MAAIIDIPANFKLSLLLMNERSSLQKPFPQWQWTHPHICCPVRCGLQQTCYVEPMTPVSSITSRSSGLEKYLNSSFPFKQVDLLGLVMP